MSKIISRKEIYSWAKIMFTYNRSSTSDGKNDALRIEKLVKEKK